MTQYTQAQIEANLKQWDEWYETLPTNLRAKLSISDFRRLGDNFYRIFVLQKPAAAQIGEMANKQVTIKVADFDSADLARAFQNLQATTIERCAQVAESFGVNEYTTYADIIAAAIRKLKDER